MTLMVIRKDSEEDGSSQASALSKPLILTSLSASSITKWQNDVNLY